MMKPEKKEEKKIHERQPFDFDMSSKKLSREKEEEICELAKKNSEHAFNKMSKNIYSFKDDYNFMLGNQFEVAEIQTYSILKQTVVVVNKLYPIVRAIVGEFIQSNPEMEAFSLSGKSDEDLIDFYQDYLNTVSYGSNGKIIWKSCVFDGLGGGFSAIKIKHGKIGDDSLEQNMYLEYCPDPTLVYFDPSAKEKSKSDGDYAGEIINMSRHEFESQHPDIDLEECLGSSFPEASERVTLNIYQQKEWYKESYIEVKSGKLWKEEAYNEALNDYYLEQESVAMEALPGVSGKFITRESKKLKLPDNLERVNDKTVKLPAYKIRTYKILGKKVIEHADWISDKYLGYIFVDCDSHWVDGEQITRSFILDAKQPQKLLNVSMTKIQYYMQTMRGERWIGTRQHIAGYEKEWRQVEDLIGMMPVNEGTGRMIRPDQITQDPINPSLFEVAAKAEADIYTCLGLGAAFRGDADVRGASGEAMKRDIAQGNKTTVVPFDGVYDAMAQVGRVLFDAAPRVLDTNRIMHLQGRDGESRSVEINKVDMEGRKSMDLSKSKYDIAIKAGMSFELQREMAFKVMTAMMQAAGPQGSIMLDKMAENLPIPGALELGRRFKATIPENIIAAGEGKQMPPPPPPPPDPKIEIENKKLELKSRELEIKTESLHASMIKMQADLQTFMENVKVQTMKGQVEIAKMTGNAEQAREAVQERRESRALKQLETLAKIGIKL